MNEIKESAVLSELKNQDFEKVKNRKKISFLGAILLIISSCIGSGIFFKSETVLNYNSGSFVLSILSWLISAIAVICMAIALLEVVSKRNDNLSMIGWCKTFNNSFIYKCCKNFMVFIYLPLEFFYLPYYTIISIQNMLVGFGVQSTFNTANDWAIWMVIGMLISSWLIFTSGINTKIADIQNKVILSIKFIPLVAVVILGIVIIANNGVNINVWPNQKPIEDVTTFYQLWPGIGMILSLSAIFFAFDGFYFAAGIQKEMKEPKKTPIAIIVGLSVVTFIYLTIAIVMSLASKTGAFNGESGYQEFLASHGLTWLFGLLNLLIAFSIVGTLNGFVTWSTRLVENLIIENELPFSDKLINKIDHNKPIVGALYVFVLAMSFFLILSIIGGLAYIPNDYLKEDGQSLYDGVGFYSSARLYTFANLLSNWASVFAFAFILFALMGCYKNRKTKKIEVVENKTFKPMCIIATIIVGSSLILTAIQPFADLFFISDKTESSVIISRIMLVVVLFVFLAITITPACFKKKVNLKK